MKPYPELLVKLKKIDVHVCDKCPKVFPNPSDLLKHKAYHDEYFLSHVVSAYVSLEKAKIFTCDKCTRSFDNKTDFVLHKVTHIQDYVRNKRNRNIWQNPDIAKPYKCPDCDVSYAAKTTLDAHSFVHLPFPHICECGIGYYKQQDLNAHIKLVHGTKIDEEDILQPKEETVIRQQNSAVKRSSEPKSKSKKSPTAKGAVKKKKRRTNQWELNLPDEVLKGYIPKSESDVPDPDVKFRVTSDKRVKCPECKKLFRDKRAAIVHYRVHSGERPFACHLCPKTFVQGGTLKLHLERHACTEKIYSCKYCPKSFTFAIYRDCHERIHSSVKSYECPFCGKGFHDPSAMTRHKRIHTGDKRYACQYCPKAYTDVSALRAHNLRHENKKQFPCQNCDKRFYNRTLLKHHMRVHTLEKTVVCDYCKKWFSSKPNLISHMRRVHISMVIKTHKIGLSKKVKCSFCSKFYTRKSLWKHIRKFHPGIRCEKCSVYFKTEGHFKAHLLGNKVQCEICDMSFICENMMDKHLEVHYAKSVETIKRDSENLNEI